MAALAHDCSIRQHPAVIAAFVSDREMIVRVISSSASAPCAFVRANSSFARVFCPFERVISSFDHAFSSSACAAARGMPALSTSERAVSFFAGATSSRYRTTSPSARALRWVARSPLAVTARVGLVRGNVFPSQRRKIIVEPFGPMIGPRSSVGAVLAGFDKTRNLADPPRRAESGFEHSPAGALPQRPGAEAP